MDGRIAHATQVPVDPPDEELDVISDVLVVVDVLAGGDGHLEHRHVGRIQQPLGKAFGERTEPNVDALGVVEAVDTEEEQAESTHLGPDLLCPGLDRRVARHGIEGRRVDADGEGADAHRPKAVLVGHVDPISTRIERHQATGRREEVECAVVGLEAHEIGAEQALQDLAPPRKLGEELDRWERDVEEEADPQVRARVAQHLRDQLQLVVMHPHRRTLGRELGRLRGEQGIHLAVGHVLGTVIRRCYDRIVIQRPERPVGEALVELLDLAVREGHADNAEPVDLLRQGWLRLGSGAAAPSDPRGRSARQRRLESADQTPGGTTPRGPGRAVGILDGESIRDDHELVGRSSLWVTWRCGHAPSSGDSLRMPIPPRRSGVIPCLGAHGWFHRMGTGWGARSGWTLRARQCHASNPTSRPMTGMIIVPPGPPDVGPPPGTPPGPPPEAGHTQAQQR